ncbi:MAG: PilZ domain-containing protein [Planctomycetes bacterium]|nr:PilZ domain-containing protein [Planctomycetota bacterium]
MSQRQSRRFDRRTATRRSRRIPAFVGPKQTPSEKCENAVVEDVSKGGLRVRSGAPLRPDESFFVYVGDKPQPMHAKVVWVRKEGLIEKRTTGKAGQAFLAGCQVQRAQEKPHDEAPRRNRKARGAARVSPGTADRMTILLRIALAAGGLGLLALVAYFVASLVNLMKG